MTAALYAAAVPRVVERGSTKSIAASVYVGVLGSAVFIMLPILLGLLAERADLSDRDIGQVASGQMAGMFIASMVAGAMFRRWGWHKPSYAAALALVGAHGFSAAAGTGIGFLILQSIGGLAGGLLMAMSLSHLGQTPRAARNFGFWVSAQIALGIVASYALPQIAAAWGVFGVFGALAAFSATAFGGIRHIERRIESGAVSSSKAGFVDASMEARLTQAGVLSLIATFVFAFGIMAYWPYVERIARFSGLTGASISNTVSLALVASLVGALIASQLPSRMGRVAPLVTAMAGMLVLLWALSSGAGSSAFAACAIALSGLWNFIVPYQLAFTAAHDPRGNFVVLYIAAAKGGYVLAPLAVGHLLDGTSYGPVYWLAGMAIAVSAVVYLIAAHIAPRAPTVP